MSVTQDIAAGIAAANAATKIATFPWKGEQNTSCGRLYAQILSYNDLIVLMKESIFELVANLQGKLNEISLTMSRISDVQADISKITAPKGILWQIEQSINAAYDLLKDPSLTPSQKAQLMAGLKSMQAKLAEVQSDLRGYESVLKQLQEVLKTQTAGTETEDKKLVDLTAQLVSMTKTINDVLGQYVSQCVARPVTSSGASGDSGDTGTTGSTGSGSSDSGGTSGSGASGVSGVSGYYGT